MVSQKNEHRKTRCKAVIRRALIALIKGYSFLISPLIGRNCRFYPTCSQYMQKSIEKHGVAKGIIMGGKRLCKCHPYYKGEIEDPVPESIAWSALLGYKRRK